MTDCIAVFNAGSSSIKVAIHGMADGPAQFRGQVEAIGVAPALKVRDAAGKVLAEHKWPVEGFDHDKATQELLQTTINLLGQQTVVAVGHRVVHGGTRFAAPVRVDDAVPVGTGNAGAVGAAASAAQPGANPSNRGACT